MNTALCLLICQNDAKLYGAASLQAQVARKKNIGGVDIGEQPNGIS